MAEVRWLPLAEVSPGTALAADLADADGQLLLTVGTRLDASLMATLTRHGIGAVPVAAPEPDAAAAAHAAELRVRHEQRFSAAARNPASRALLETLLAYRLERRGG